MFNYSSSRKIPKSLYLLYYRCMVKLKKPAKFTSTKAVNLKNTCIHASCISIHTGSKIIFSMNLASNSWATCMYIFHKDGSLTTIGLLSCMLLFRVRVLLYTCQQPKWSGSVSQRKWLDSINNYTVFHQYTHQCKYHKRIMFDHISM